MKPPGHAAISIGIGGIVWAVTKSPYSMAAAVATGVAVDLDHLLEYYLWFVKGDNSRVFFLLHSYELLVPCILAGVLSGGDPVVIGVSAAFLGHLLTDQIANPMHPLAYFLTFRVINGFNRAKLIRQPWKELEADFLKLYGAKAVLGRFTKGQHNRTS